MTATPAAPARMHSRGVRRVDAADRDDRNRDRETDVAEPVEPDRRSRVGLRRRLPDRPGANVRRAGELRQGSLTPFRDRDPERETRLARPFDPRVALAEMDATAKLERRVDVVVDDELDLEIAERCGRARQLLRWSLPSTAAAITVAPPAAARRAVSSSDTSACTLMRPCVKHNRTACYGASLCYRTQVSSHVHLGPFGQGRRVEGGERVVEVHVEAARALRV